MIGKHLTKMLLDKGYEVIVMSRKLGVESQESGISFAKWDVDNQTIDANAIAKADHIIHLAGASVAEKRWTAKRKKEIVDSRTQSSALIVKALKEIPNHVKAVISMSAIGWYGADTEESLQHGFKEDAKADTEFLGATCKVWEESIEPVALNKRLVKLRTGIVLSNTGGAFVEFKKPLKTGVATVFGNGKQVVSWIHIDDLCRMFIHAIEHEEMNGVYNAVATHPLTNKELMISLGKKMRGQFFIPVFIPAFLLKIILGEMSIELLKSARVNNDKIKSTGFYFLYPTIDAALKNLINRK
ncbi:epimerase family protein [mine drainage metagenome]|uniref:Epimerase family protein n=1 Tax=mine drainage metagenome TaxID=410659 RepID=A0A1J5SMV3_9ZZZZ